MGVFAVSAGAEINFQKSEPSDKKALLNFLTFWSQNTSFSGKGGAGLRRRPLPKAEAPTEPTGEKGDNPLFLTKSFPQCNFQRKIDFTDPIYKTLE